MAIELVRCSKGQAPAFPGLSLDGRQVVVGANGLIRVPTWSSLVGLVGLLSAEFQFGRDGLAVRLLVHKGLQEEFFVLVRPEGSLRTSGQVSLVFDRIAGLTARWLGDDAPMMVGGADVFVRYRDRASPTGYDLSRPPEPDPGRALSLFPFAGERVDVAKPDLRRLSFHEGFLARLRPVPVPERSPGARYVLCMPDLAAPLERVFRRRALEVSVASLTKKGSGDEPVEMILFRLGPRGGRGEAVMAHWTERLDELPGAMLLEESYLSGEGGESARGVLVPAGTRAPVWMPHVASELPEGSLLVLTAGTRRNLDLRPFPRFVPLDRLTVADAPPKGVERGEPGDAAAVLPRRALKLRPGIVPAGQPPSAALLTPEETGWLGHLIGRVPAGRLESLRGAPTPEGLLVVAERGAIDTVPFGLALRRHRVGGLLLPLGSAFEPEVPDEVLREKLALTEGAWTVFLEGVRLEVPIQALRPLQDLIVDVAPVPEVVIAAAEAPANRTGVGPRAVYEAPPQAPAAVAPDTGRGWRRWLSWFIDWGRRESGEGGGSRERNLRGRD